MPAPRLGGSGRAAEGSRSGFATPSPPHAFFDPGGAPRRPVAAHAPAAQVTRQCQFARLSPQIMAPLDFKNQLKLAEAGIQLFTVRDNRQIEDAATQCPVPLVPFESSPIGIPPRVSSIIKRPGVYERPIQEIMPGII